jgi:hypothetical protein
MNDLVGKQYGQISAQTVTPMDMLQMAIQQGADLDKLEKLMDMKDRHEANEARKAYVQAMSAFRSGCPAIAKTRDGHNNRYAGLAETIEQIKGVLSACGLSHSWEMSQQGESITVTCCITHSMGHQECTSMTAPPDAGGSKNKIQAIASTVSYLERYTLFAKLGLASAEMDDDGNLSGTKVEYISAEQIATLESLAEEVGVKTQSMCAHYNCRHIGVFPAKLYNDAVANLEGRRK